MQAKKDNNAFFILAYSFLLNLKIIYCTLIAWDRFLYNHTQGKYLQKEQYSSMELTYAQNHYLIVILLRNVCCYLLILFCIYLCNKKSYIHWTLLIG